MVSLFEINCLQQKQQVLQFALYNFDGSIVSSSDGDLNDWLRPAPGSIGLLQLNYVCNPSNFINSPHPQKKIIKTKKPKIIL